MHTIVAACVVAGSAIIAIVVFTVVVGTSFGEGTTPLVDQLPAMGSEIPAEPSTASDALKKPWDQLTDDDKALIKSEVNRVFNDATFRASNGLVAGIDVKIVGGQTQFSRGYVELKDPTPHMRFAQSLVFYCPIGDGNVHYYKYLTAPSGTTPSDVVQPEGNQPWETIVSRINWDLDVTDLGMGEVGGRRVHGYRVIFNYTDPDAPEEKKGDYWFDVENARLLARQEYIEGKNTQKTRYILQWRTFAPPQVDASQPQPDCVPDLLAKYGNG